MPGIGYCDVLDFGLCEIGKRIGNHTAVPALPQCYLTPRIDPASINKNQALFYQVIYISDICRREHIKRRAVFYLLLQIAASGKAENDASPGVGLECVRDLAKDPFQVRCSSHCQLRSGKSRPCE